MSAEVSPWSVSVLELPMTPGSQRECNLEVAAPDDLGTAVLSVPRDTTIKLEVDLLSVEDGVLASVFGTIPVQGACMRCLQDINWNIDIDTSDLYLPEGTRKTKKVEISEEEDVEELPTIEHSRINLEPLVRDELLPKLPFVPLCKPDCMGLCPDCGVRWEDTEEGHHHLKIDPRWAALAQLQGEEQSANVESTIVEYADPQQQISDGAKNESS